MGNSRRYGVCKVYSIVRAAPSFVLQFTQTCTKVVLVQRGRNRRTDRAVFVGVYRRTVGIPSLYPRHMQYFMKPKN